MWRLQSQTATQKNNKLTPDIVSRNMHTIRYTEERHLKEHLVNESLGVAVNVTPVNT
jgi:hypothetical protein